MIAASPSTGGGSPASAALFTTGEREPPFSEALLSALLEHWERQPFSLPAGAIAPCHPDRFFGIVQQACRAGSDVRVFAGGRSVGQPGEQAPWLPLEDADFGGYARRVDAELGGREYMVRVGHLHRHDPELWRWVRGVLDGLFERVGMPNEAVTTGLFMGRYRRTPFGVHLDDEAALTFPIVGHKRVRTWPDEYVEARPQLKQALSYDQWCEGSRLVEAGPGGALYWPSRAWHVAEGGDQFVAAWNISFWYDDVQELSARILERVRQESSRLARERALPSGGRSIEASPASPGLPCQLPPALAEIGTLLKDSVDRVLRKEWIQRRSAAGFRVLAENEPRRSPIELETLFRGDRRSQLLWTDLGPGLIAFSANGQVFELTDHPGWRMLFQAIQDGEPLSARSLLEEVAADPRAADEALDEGFALELLSALRDAGAIEEL